MKNTWGDFFCDVLAVRLVAIVDARSHPKNIGALRSLSRLANSCVTSLFLLRPYLDGWWRGNHSSEKRADS